MYSLWLALIASTTAVAHADMNPSAAGFNFLGCYTDNDGFRALHYTPSVPGGWSQMTVDRCVSTCTKLEYAFAGVENYHECWCGNSLDAQSTHVPAYQCHLPCAGNRNEICGGSNRLSVFHSNVTVPANQPPRRRSSITQDIGSGYTFVDCFADSRKNRAVYGLYHSYQDTLSSCASTCAAIDGAVYLSMSYYGECFCGKYLNDSGGKSRGCKYACTLNETEVCGGQNAAQIYHRAPLHNNTSTSSVISSAAPSNRTSSMTGLLLTTAVPDSLTTLPLYTTNFTQTTITPKFPNATSTSFNDTGLISKASVASSRSAANAVLSTSRYLASISKASVNAALSSSRAEANLQKSITRDSILASKSTVNAYLASSRNIVRASKSTLNAYLSSSRAAARASKSTLNAYLSSSRDAARASKSSSVLAASLSRASATRRQSPSIVPVSVSQTFIHTEKTTSTALAAEPTVTSMSFMA